MMSVREYAEDVNLSVDVILDLCNKLDMNMSQLVIYLIDAKYFELLHKEDDINE